MRAHVHVNLKTKNLTQQSHPDIQSLRAINANDKIVKG